MAANGPSINLVSALERVTTAPRARKGKQAIHLRQGDGDGGCGPYCAWMALMAYGKLDREDIEGLGVDRRTRFGRFLKLAQHDDFGPFFRHGSNEEELAELLRASFGAEVEVTEPEEDDHLAVRRFIIESLREDKLVIVGVEGKGLSHWLLAVGLELKPSGKPKAILLLDPAAEAPTWCAWNAVLDLVSPATLRKRAKKKGKEPLRHGNGQVTKVTLDEAIAIAQRGL